MSTSLSFDLLGLKVAHPRFDFLLKFLNSREIQLPHSYMKYFVFFSIVLGLKYLTKFLLDRFQATKNIVKSIMPSPTVASNRWVAILGFGDNEVSITLAKYFSKRGYNLLLLVSSKVLKVRNEYNLNEIQEIDKLTHIKILEYDYDGFSAASDFELSESGLIEYIFDTSVLRLYNEDLSSEDKESHLNCFFFNDAVSMWTKKYMTILDKLKLYFCIKSDLHPVKIFVFNYPDKNDEVNHKIFYEFRKSLYMQYQEIFKNSVVFNVIKYHNEFKGQYLKDSQLKSLEVQRFPGLGSELNFN